MHFLGVDDALQKATSCIIDAIDCATLQQEPEIVSSLRDLASKIYEVHADVVSRSGGDVFVEPMIAQIETEYLREGLFRRQKALIERFIEDSMSYKSPGSGGEGVQGGDAPPVSHRILEAKEKDRQVVYLSFVLDRLEMGRELLTDDERRMLETRCRDGASWTTVGVEFNLGRTATYSARKRIFSKLLPLWYGVNVNPGERIANKARTRSV